MTTRSQLFPTTVQRRTFVPRGWYFPEPETIYYHYITFFGPKSCHHEMIFSWTKQKSTWVSKWQSAVKRIKWWKIKGSPLASRFCQSCHLPLEEKRTIRSNSSRNKVQSTLNLISPDMWINIEHVMCVVPKCCHALWEPHKYLDVPKNILMYLRTGFCILF